MSRFYSRFVVDPYLDYNTIDYVDVSKTHSDNELPLSITVVQGPELSKPTPKPTATKKPVDGCAKQIKN